MLINKNYAGLGNFFANPWSVLIIVKHVLVLAFLVVAMYSERAFLPHIGDREPQALNRLRAAMNLNAVLGTVIVLLTSVAQVP
jgi:putative copper export protein